MSQTPPPHGSYSSQEQYPQHQHQQYNPYQQQNPYGGQPPKKKKGPIFWILTILGSLLGLLFLLFILLFIIGALVSGGDNNSSSVSGESTTSQAQEKTTAEPKVTPSKKSSDSNTSSRGNPVIALNQPAGATATNTGENVYKMTVKSFEVDPVCTGESAARYPSENGHFVKVNLDIEMGTPQAAKDGHNGKGLYTREWKFINKDGTTFNGELTNTSTTACASSSEQVPSSVEPGEKVSGSVILDVPETKGTLLFEDITLRQYLEYELK